MHRVQTDHAQLDPQQIARDLAGAALWLTPNAVKGFNPRDFRELSPELRERLAAQIERFVEVAKKVPPKGPASPQQLKAATPAFLQILEILRPYFPDRDELLKLREVLTKKKFPFVESWDSEFGADSTGDPAIWIWVVVKDETAKQADFAELSSEVERSIREAIASSGISRWPYIRFRAISELRALAGSFR